MKLKLIEMKSESYNLQDERNMLSDKAGMITNTVLLRDFKETNSKIEKTALGNNNLKSKFYNFIEL